MELKTGKMCKKIVQPLENDSGKFLWRQTDISTIQCFMDYLHIRDLSVVHVHFILTIHFIHNKTLFIEEACVSVYPQPNQPANFIWINHAYWSSLFLFSAHLDFPYFLFCGCTFPPLTVPHSLYYILQFAFLLLLLLLLPLFYKLFLRSSTKK